jgi:hypothetical protein
LASDISTSSTSYADVLSRSITTGAGFLLIGATASASATSGNRKIFFEITVDGTFIEGSAFSSASANDAQGMAVGVRVAVTAAAHTVKLRWKVGSGTGQIRASSVPLEEHADLTCQEVTV